MKRIIQTYWFVLMLALYFLVGLWSGFRDHVDWLP